jgi:hypothetical protein
VPRCWWPRLVVAAIAWLALGQFILRKGGTDVQWLWFPGDPPGLEDLRRQARDRKHASKDPPP